MEYKINPQNTNEGRKRFTKDNKNETRKFNVEKPTPVKRKKKSAVWKISVLLFILLLGSMSFFVGAAIYAIPAINTIEVDGDLQNLGILHEDNLKGSQKDLEELAIAKDGTLNILLMGVDGVGYENVRADVMIIATIRKGSDKILLTSIQRDTIAYIPMYQTYEKLNHTFAYGGANETLKAINMNYDLNIEDVVVFDYDALVTVIDEIGGVTVNVDAAMLDEINEHIRGDYIPNAGEQVLNGEQALGYARARYGEAGGVTGRDSRQREILYKIFEYAKGQGVMSLYNLANEIMPKIQTSYDFEEITSLIDYFDTIRDSSMEDQEFPFEWWGGLIDDVYLTVPQTVESNIIELHKRIFGVSTYEISDRARGYAEEIMYRTGVY